MGPVWKRPSSGVAMPASNSIATPMICSLLNLVGFFAYDFVPNSAQDRSRFRQAWYQLAQ
jgi:hypothetical protein